MSRKSSRALMAIGLIAMAAATAPAAHAGVFPSEVECASYNPAAGTVKARLVAVNTEHGIETIGIGTSNFFFPDEEDRGQPAQFLPGRQGWDLDLPVSSSEVFWGLDGHYLEFTPDADWARFGRPCADRGPQITSVQPTALHRGSQDQRLTIYGQGLAGSDVTIAGDGVHATAITDTSDQRLDVRVDVDADADLSARNLLVTDPDHLQTGCRHCVALDDPDPAPQPAAPHVTQVKSAPKPFRDGIATVTATCPSGQSVTGGGYALLTSKPDATVLENRPLVAGGWRVILRAPSASPDARVQVYATCI